LSSIAASFSGIVVAVMNKKKERREFDSIFSAVMKKMAKPRLAASARDKAAKFQVTELLHNRDTAEDGAECDSRCDE
jgi:hypothetical protein